MAWARLIAALPKYQDEDEDRPADDFDLEEKPRGDGRKPSADTLGENPAPTTRARKTESDVDAVAIEILKEDLWSTSSLHKRMKERLSEEVLKAHPAFKDEYDRPGPNFQAAYQVWRDIVCPPVADPSSEQRIGAVRLVRVLPSLDKVRINDALKHIPPHERDIWWRIGASIFHASGGSQEGFEIWSEWSSGECPRCRGACKKFDPAEQQKTWSGYRERVAGRQLTIATLYKIAQEHGAGIGLPPRAAVDYLNERYISVGNIQGKARIIDEESFGKHDLEYLSHTDFREAFCHIHVENGEGKTMPLGAFWVASPTKRHFDRASFLPGSPPEVEGTLNLWRGFAYEPLAGSGDAPDFLGYDDLCRALGVSTGFGRGWDSFLRVIVQGLAGGNIDHAIYLIRVAAWKLQNLDKLPRVAVVLRGDEEGSGKSSYGVWLGELVGRRHFNHLQDPSELDEKFNDRQGYGLISLADEVFFAGDPRQRGKLFNRITAETVRAEGKNLHKRMVANYTLLIMTTNLAWAVPASLTARRFAVFSVDPVFVGNKDFWQEVYWQLGKGGYAASLHDLLGLPLGDWLPHENVPQTEALLEQKRLSLSPEVAWAFDLAEEGDLAERKGKDFVAARWLIAKAKSFQPRLEKASSKTIMKIFADLDIPVAESGGKGRRMPHLQEFRRRLNALYPGYGEWDAAETPNWNEECEPEFEKEKFLKQTTTEPNFTEKI